MFEYEAIGNLHLKRGTYDFPRWDQMVIDVSFASPVGGQITGTLVQPYLTVDDRPPPDNGFAGVLIMHAHPVDRDAFRTEALAYADADAITLILDPPERGVEDVMSRVLDAVAAETFVRHSILTLRRGIDVLSEEGADVSRLAFVGQGLGGSLAGLLAAAEPRIGSVVAIGGAGDMPRWWPLSNPEARQGLQPYDSVRHAGRSRASFLFQVPLLNWSLSPSATTRYFDALPPPKQLRRYLGRGVGGLARWERMRWLRRQLGGSAALSS